MAACAGREARRPVACLARSHHLDPPRELEGHGVNVRQARLRKRTRSVGAEVALRQRGQLDRERFGLPAGGARRHDAVSEPDGERLGGADLAAGQDQVKRAGEADEPG